jgi:alpha-tubulin suppressor-like RCC1 family protein
MIIKDDGSLWGTGWNEYAQLGNGNKDSITKFEKVEDGVADVFCGYFITMVIKEDSSLWVTGEN